MLNNEQITDKILESIHVSNKNYYLSAEEIFQDLKGKIFKNKQLSHIHVFRPILPLIIAKEDIIESVQQTVLKGDNANNPRHIHSPFWQSSHNILRESLYNENTIKPLLKDILSDEIKLGIAIGKGDCFFDSIAQCLNQSEGKESFDIKSLRLFCDEYAKDSKNNWVATANQKDGMNHNEYLVRIQFTAQELEEKEKNKLNLGPAIWGRPKIEGRMLCEKYGIKLHVIEIQENGTFNRFLIDEKGEKEEINPNINYRDVNILHIVNYHNHYVPLIRASAFEKKDQPPLTQLAERSLIINQPLSGTSNSVDYVNINGSLITQDTILPNHIKRDATLENDNHGNDCFLAAIRNEIKTIATKSQQPILIPVNLADLSDIYNHNVAVEDEWEINHWIFFLIEPDAFTKKISKVTIIDPNQTWLDRKREVLQVSHQYIKNMSLEEYDNRTKFFIKLWREKINKILKQLFISLPDEVEIICLSSGYSKNCNVKCLIYEKDSFNRLTEYLSKKYDGKYAKDKIDLQSSLHNHQMSMFVQIEDDKRIQTNIMLNLIYKEVLTNKLIYIEKLIKCNMDRIKKLDLANKSSPNDEKYGEIIDFHQQQNIEMKIKPIKDKINGIICFLHSLGASLANNIMQKATVMNALHCAGFDYRNIWPNNSFNNYLTILEVSLKNNWRKLSSHICHKLMENNPSQHDVNQLVELLSKYDDIMLVKIVISAVSTYFPRIQLQILKTDNFVYYYLCAYKYLLKLYINNAIINKKMILDDLVSLNAEGNVTIKLQSIPLDHHIFNLLEKMIAKTNMSKLGSGKLVSLELNYIYNICDGQWLNMLISIIPVTLEKISLINCGINNTNAYKVITNLKSVKKIILDNNLIDEQLLLLLMNARCDFHNKIKMSLKDNRILIRHKNNLQSFEIGLSHLFKRINIAANLVYDLSVNSDRLRAAMCSALVNILVELNKQFLSANHSIRELVNAKIVVPLARDKIIVVNPSTDKEIITIDVNNEMQEAFTNIINGSSLLEAENACLKDFHNIENIINSLKPCFEVYLNNISKFISCDPSISTKDSILDLVSLHKTTPLTTLTQFSLFKSKPCEKVNCVITPHIEVTAAKWAIHIIAKPVNNINFNQHAFIGIEGLDDKGFRKFNVSHLITTDDRNPKIVDSSAFYRDRIKTQNLDLVATLVIDRIHAERLLNKVLDDAQNGMNETFSKFVYFSSNSQDINCIKYVIDSICNVLASEYANQTKILSKIARDSLYNPSAVVRNIIDKLKNQNNIEVLREDEASCRIM